MSRFRSILFGGMPVFRNKHNTDNSQRYQSDDKEVLRWDNITHIMGIVFLSIIAISMLVGLIYTFCN